MDNQLKMNEMKTFLKGHINLLDQIKREINNHKNKNNHNTRNKRYSNINNNNHLANDNDFELSNKYLKLSKTAEFIRKNILSDVERPDQINDYYSDYETLQDYMYL